MYPTEIRDGFLYIAILNRLSLADAKKTCNALHLNSHLVSMVTEEEANAVEDFITDTGEVNQKFWIGLHSPRVVWDDGNYLTFHELDIVRSNENCFSIEEPEFEWESLECTEKRHYICEAKKSGECEKLKIVLGNICISILRLGTIIGIHHRYRPKFPILILYRYR